MQVADLTHRIVLIGAQFVGQLFRVQPPALDVGREAQQVHQQRRRLALLLQADLQVVARRRLVIGQGRQGPGWPFRRVLQIDPVDAGPRPIQAGRVVIAHRRAGLDLGRDALDLDLGLGQAAEGVGQTGLHVGHLGVQLGDQLGLAGVGVGVDVFGIVPQGLDPLGDRTLCQALGLQQDIGARRQIRHLFHAGAVDLVGGQPGRGDVAQAVGVILLALRQAAHRGLVHGVRLGGLEYGVLGGQGRIDPLGHKPFDLGAPVAGQALGAGAVDNRLGQGRGRRRRRQDAVLLADGLGQDEVGRDDAQRIVFLQSIRLGHQNVGEGVDAGDIGVGVGGRLDRVLVGQEVGRGLIGAALLADAVRIGPAALAVRDVVGGDHPVQILGQAVVVVGVARIEFGAVDAGQVGALATGEGALVVFLGACRNGQFGLGGGAVALVQAEHGDDLRALVQRLLERGVHEGLQLGGGVALRCPGLTREGGAADGDEAGAQRGGLKKTTTIEHGTAPRNLDAAMETAWAEAASEIADSRCAAPKKKARRIAPPGLISLGCEVA